MSTRSICYGFIGASILYPVVSTIYARLKTLGAFRSPFRLHGTGEIKFIHDTINAEDLHYHEASGLLFTACQGIDGTRQGWFPPLTRFNADVIGKADGGLRVIDPATFQARRLVLEGFTGPFITHGIDIITDPANPKAIYIHAVNHLPNPSYSSSSTLPKASSRIEIFHHILGTSTATHVRTVSHPLIKTPNDIYSTGPGSFYVTNDHRHREGGMRLLEDLGTKRITGWSDIIHVDAEEGKTGEQGVRAKVSLTGLHNNNGLGHSDRPEEVLICDAAGGITYIAKIQPDHALKVLSEVELDTTIDNPSWFQDPYASSTGRDASGLILAGLVNASSLDHELNNGPVAPIVWHAIRVSNDKWEKKVIFQDDGELLKSASTAVLLAIDPAKNGGRKEGWLWVTGFASKGVVVVKVKL